MSKVDNTIRAVWMIKECESLLASAAFYGAAHQLQQIRDDVSRCSVTSVEEGKPDDGKYSPRTIGQAAEQNKDASK